MESKKQLRYIFHCIKYGEGGRLLVTCGEASFCPQAVGTPLLPHQKQALSWMCARENKCTLPPFWEKKGELYYNRLTCFSAKEMPESVCGGILADDMGLVSHEEALSCCLSDFIECKYDFSTRERL